ncbi:hypothetical protein [Nannocystis pusilla]|uniref:hypothetical protein n=1 Tax=Nannocystis pusilla TaxID=889268 RepID=UPI003B78B3CF
MTVVRRDGISFEVHGDRLHVRAHEYHAGPAHLSGDELAALGLVALRPSSVGDDGVLAGDFRFVAGPDGLIVFVMDYHAAPLELAVAELGRLGLGRREPG